MSKFGKAKGVGMLNNSINFSQVSKVSGTSQRKKKFKKKVSLFKQG
jgi:hypothetical protein